MHYSACVLLIEKTRLHKNINKKSGMHLLTFTINDHLFSKRINFY
jgi:hypothetical protein